MLHSAARNKYLAKLEVESYPAGEESDVIVVNPDGFWGRKPKTRPSAPVNEWELESSDKKYLYDKVDTILKETADYIAELATQFKVVESNLYTIETKPNAMSNTVIIHDKEQ